MSAEQDDGQVKFRSTSSVFRWVCRCAVTVSVAALCLGPARADYIAAKSYFDTQPFEKRLAITLGLIATGDYEGLFDFGFTKRYYNAVIAFESREDLTVDGMLDDHEQQRLGNIAGRFYGPLGIKYYTHPAVGSELLVPRQIFDTETSSQYGIDFERNDGSLSLSFMAIPKQEQSFGESFYHLSRSTHRRQIAYKRLRDNYFVVNGTFDGRNFYSWMSAIPSGSTGFTLTWSDAWSATGSKLVVLLANTFVARPKPGSPQPVAPPSDFGNSAAQASSSPEPPPSVSTGTGVRVSEAGHILTNFHVAGKCQSITVRKPGQLAIDADLVASDVVNDLALIQAKTPLSGSIASFAAASPRAGEDIAVFGFPLSDVLSESGNIVTGNITSLAGFGNDSRLYQISAPVQPGNSGGPVMDRSGHVVAIVVAKLNALNMAKQTGDVPQNVNFAIKGNIAENFLDGARIRYGLGAVAAPLDTPAVAEMAQGFTYLITCRN